MAKQDEPEPDGQIFVRSDVRAQQGGSDPFALESTLRTQTAGGDGTVPYPEPEPPFPVALALIVLALIAVLVWRRRS